MTTYDARKLRYQILASPEGVTIDDALRAAQLAAFEEAIAACEAAFTPVCELCKGKGTRENPSFVDSSKQITQPCSFCHGRGRCRYAGIDTAIDTLRELAAKVPR